MWCGCEQVTSALWASVFLSEKWEGSNVIDGERGAARSEGEEKGTSTLPLDLVGHKNTVIFACVEAVIPKRGRDLLQGDECRDNMRPIVLAAPIRRMHHSFYLWFGLYPWPPVPLGGTDMEVCTERIWLPARFPSTSSRNNSADLLETAKLSR